MGFVLRGSRWFSKVPWSMGIDSLQKGGPLKIASALRFVARSERFPVRDLPDDLGGEAKLVLARNRILEERPLHRRQNFIGSAIGGENRLIGQIGGVQRKLVGQPGIDPHLLELLDSSRCGAPGSLVEEPGRGVVGHFLAESCAANQGSKER